MAKKNTSSKNRKPSTLNLPIVEKPTTRNALALGPDGTLPAFKALPYAQKKLEVLKALTIVYGILWEKWLVEFEKRRKKDEPRFRKIDALQRKKDRVQFGSKRYFKLDSELYRLRGWRDDEGKELKTLGELKQFVQRKLYWFTGDDEKPFLQSWDGPFLFPWTKNSNIPERDAKIKEAEQRAKKSGARRG